MEENTATSMSGGNGASQLVAGKKVVHASASVSGRVATLEIHGIDEKVVVDTSKLPERVAHDGLAFGVSALLRMSHQGCGTSGERLAAAKKFAADLMSGKWKPGIRASGGKAPKEPDELVLAIAEAFEVTPDHVEKVSIPRHLAKAFAEARMDGRIFKDKAGRERGAKDVEATERAKLASLPKVATVLAKRAADRARAAGKTPAPMFEA